MNCDGPLAPAFAAARGRRSRAAIEWLPVNDSPTTVAVVGIGGYGEVYVRALLDDAAGRPVTFVAGVDPYPQRSPRVGDLHARRVPVFPSLSAMYDAGLTPDLIVLASPLPLHAEQAVLALGRGSHVLCEKPIAATPDEAAAMIDARDRSGRMLAVGFQWAFDAGVRRLRADVRDGRFGPPRRFRTRVYWPRNHAYYARNGWAGRLATADGRPVLDSPVNNACAHFVQNMLYVLGEDEGARQADWPAVVTAELYRANDIENYDTAVIRCHTRRGVQLLVAVSHATHQHVDPTFDYEFERATVSSGGPDGKRVVARMAGGDAVDYGLQPRGEDDGKLWDVIDAIRRGAPPACGAEAAAAHTALTYAAQQSSAVVSFPRADVVVTGDPGRRSTYVPGLEAVLDRCYDGRALPSELGVPWARAGRPVRVDGLTRFTRIDGAA